MVGSLAAQCLTDGFCSTLCYWLNDEEAGLLCFYKKTLESLGSLFSTYLHDGCIEEYPQRKDTEESLAHHIHIIDLLLNRFCCSICTPGANLLIHATNFPPHPPQTSPEACTFAPEPKCVSTTRFNSATFRHRNSHTAQIREISGAIIASPVEAQRAIQDVSTTTAAIERLRRQLTKQMSVFTFCLFLFQS